MKLKNDKYRKTRGGRSRMLEIRCEKCNSLVCYYQKDGPGILKRIYIDRIFNPKVSVSGKNFVCSKGHLLGVKIIYAKEKRPAFYLFVGSIKKKIVKSSSANL